MEKELIVYTKREIVCDIAEHEILLSFNDDAGAVAFDIWFNECGKTQLEEWCQKNGYDVFGD